MKLLLSLTWILFFAAPPALGPLRTGEGTCGARDNFGSATLGTASVVNRAPDATRTRESWTRRRCGSLSGQEDETGGLFPDRRRGSWRSNAAATRYGNDTSSSSARAGCDRRRRRDNGHSRKKGSFSDCERRDRRRQPGFAAVRRHFHCAVVCAQDPYSVSTPMKMVVPSDLVVSSESETSPSFVWKTLALTLVVAFSIVTNRTAGIRRSRTRTRWGRIDGQADEGCPSGSLRKRRPRQAHRRDVPRLRWRSPGRAR
jgi:hypothetical protein